MFNETGYAYKSYLNEDNQITIPVVFHVIAEDINAISNIPYSRIVHQMNALNEAFNGGANGMEL
ncbi:MAG: hypothetical protein SGI87_00795 [Flavobacteriales bacterium]|nr:hypothetical protein [Flavobacteriales bacterium]